MKRDKSRAMTEAINALKNPCTPEWRKQKAVAVLLLGDIHALTETYGLDSHTVITGLLHTVGVWFGVNGFGPSNNDNTKKLLDSARDVVGETLDNYLFTATVGSKAGEELKSMVRDKDSKLH